MRVLDSLGPPASILTDFHRFSMIFFTKASHGPRPMCRAHGPGPWAARAGPALGSTRAGGKDHGSLHKLPQMKIIMNVFFKFEVIARHVSPPITHAMTILIKPAKITSNTSLHCNGTTSRISNCNGAPDQLCLP